MSKAPAVLAPRAIITTATAIAAPTPTNTATFKDHTVVEIINLPTLKDLGCFLRLLLLDTHL
jgi:hypothetical protein